MPLSIHLQKELATYFQYATQENPSIIVQPETMRGSAKWTQTDENIQRAFSRCIKCNQLRFSIRDAINNLRLTRNLFWCEDCVSQHRNFTMNYVDNPEFHELYHKLRTRKITAKEILAKQES